MPTWDTSGTYQYDISSGADALLVTLQGAPGGPATDASATGDPGNGGELTVRIPTSALPSTVEVVVGGTTAGEGNGGFNGGGAAAGGFYNSIVSGAGGGASDIRDVGGGYDTRYAAAGGGGGGAAESISSVAGTGGDGGYPTGDNGRGDFDADDGSAWPYSYGEGGQETRGGYGGTTRSVSGTIDGNDGSLGEGGNAVSESLGGGEDEDAASGAGGGGWYGGGSGAAKVDYTRAAGGGGGSSGAQNSDWVESHTTGANSSLDGSVTITELTVTASGLSVPYAGAGEVDLDWDGANADSFEVERDGAVIDSTTSTTLTDSGASENTTHTYQVFAVYDGVREASTDTVSVTTGGPPTTTSITEGDRAFELSAGGLTGDWTELRIYRNSPEHDHEIAYSGDPDVTVTDSGLLDGLDYTYEFVGVYPRGESSVVTETGSLPMPNPTDFRIVDVDGDQFTVEMRDRANHKDGYRVWRGPDGYLEFDADGERVNVPDQPEFNPTDTLTLFARFRVSSTPNSASLIDKASYNQYQLRVEDDGEVVFVTQHTDGTDTVYSDTRSGYLASPDDVVEVMAVYDKDVGEKRVYIDDFTDPVYVDTETNGGDPLSDWHLVTKSIDPRLGEYRQTGRAFKGDLFEAQIHASALTESEMQEAANGQPPAESLSGWWLLNDGSGDTATDYSGNGNDGTLVNSPTWVDGGPMVQDGNDLDPQYALRFDGAAVEVPDAPALNIAGSGFSVFVRASHPGNSSHTLVSKTADLDFYAQGWNISRAGNPNDVYCVIQGDNENNVSPQFGVSTPYGPTSFGFSFDGETAELYKDGAPAGSETNSDIGDVTVSEPLRVGTGYAAIDDGIVDEVIGFDRVLSDQEFASLENGDVPSGVAFRYEFNDGPGSETVSDSSGNGNDGTVNGDPEWVAPLTPIRHTTEDLSDGERYVLRGSAFTEDTEVFDR